MTAHDLAGVRRQHIEHAQRLTGQRHEASLLAEFAGVSIQFERAESKDHAATIAQRTVRMRAIDDDDSAGGLTAKLTSGAEVAVAKPCRAELEERLKAMP